MDKKYTIAVEFEKFTKTYEHVTNYSIGETALQIVDKKGIEHNYNLSKVLAYHVEEE